jgi:DNA-binding FadR family transcriptional regulator
MIGVERKSLSTHVADTLRQLIISNTYTQGRHLPAVETVDE